MQYFQMYTTQVNEHFWQFTDESITDVGVGVFQSPKKYKNYRECRDSIDRFIKSIKREEKNPVAVYIESIHVGDDDSSHLWSFLDKDDSTQLCKPLMSFSSKDKAMKESQKYLKILLDNNYTIKEE